jgi:hypothetical protein
MADDTRLGFELGGWHARAGGLLSPPACAVDLLPR